MVLLSQRSFELVHADVFHTDAKVSDVLALIPRSATQEEIRKQHYTGLYDISSGQCQSIGPHHRKENEVISVEKNALIRTVVGNKKNGVLVPMPANLLENECARRTRTILARPEIVEMVRFCSNDEFENLSVLHPFVCSVSFALSLTYIPWRGPHTHRLNFFKIWWFGM